MRQFVSAVARAHPPGLPQNARMVHVLVTGGAGFIGSHIGRALLERGDAVTVLDDLSQGTDDGVPAGARLVRADISSPDTVAAIGDAHPDAVIHAAAQVSVVASMADPAHDRAINVVGTQHVLAGAREAGVQRFVFLSSGGAVYGESDGADEATAPRPASYYAIHKLAAEGYVAVSGLSHANARLANVYGPGQRTGLEGGVVAIFAERLRAGGALTIFGDGEQRRDFLHVHDVVRAILAMLDSDRDGTWNVGTGVATSVNRLVELMLEESGGAAPVEHAPERAGELHSSRLAIGKIAADLRWAPQLDLRSGLASIV